MGKWIMRSWVFSKRCPGEIWLLEGKLEEEINGKLVIMGFNALGLSDCVVPETSNRYPGHEVLAVSIDHILKTLSHSSRQ